jgi:hypothetical protein
MELDFKIFYNDRLITEVQKRPALYNKAIPEYSDKNCKEKLWIEDCEAVLPNWSRLDTRERVATGKKCKLFSCSLQFIRTNGRILFQNLSTNFDKIK